MFLESDLRRPQFSPGFVARLADGQTWTFPASSDPGLAGPEYQSLLLGLHEAADAPERDRAELALVIYLLGVNYQLTPKIFASILDSSGDDLRRDRLRATVRSIAAAYSEQGGTAPEPVPRTRRCWWSRFLRLKPTSAPDSADVRRLD